MNKIFKYIFTLDDVFHIEFPGLEPTILKIAKQPGHPHGVYCMWALVDADSKETCKKEFRVYGTGHDVPFGKSFNRHIETIVDSGYVWHFFEWME